MPNRPFSSIALSLSGGGYRATAYHLGTLSFLNHIAFPTETGEKKTLLENVEVLSTISGGTFTGMMWAYYNSKEESFEACFQKLYDLLEQDNLIDAAFEKLNGKRKWKNKNKSLNLINAFAEVYNDDFFDQASFSTFLGKDSKLTIHSLIFNATEFRNGLAFRFQNNGFFGNKKIRLDDAIVGEIKLGDIVASSSCFPGGFEPLIFPNDFIQAKDSVLAKNWKAEHMEPVAIMDGGIIDNQGIDGVKLAADRLTSKRNQANFKKGIDTFIVSDVEGKVIQALDLPSTTSKNSTFTINRLKNRLNLFFIFSMILFLFSLWLVIAKSNFWWIIGIVLGSIIAFLSGSANYLIRRIGNWLGTKSQSVVNQSGGDLLLNLGIIFNTPLNVLKRLLILRATSTLTMVNDVFLKRIRRIQYNSLYDNPQWQPKMITNTLYSLKEPKNREHLSTEVKAIIESASTMPTSLWFSKREKDEKVLDHLIITGQLTICFKLKDFLMKKKRLSNYKEIYKGCLPQIDQLYKELEDCLKLFNDQPDWLLKKLKRE